MGQEGLGRSRDNVSVNKSPAGADNPLDAVGRSANID
jgi:hypothetical protein